MKNTKENCEISKIDNTNTDKRSRANHLVDKRKNGFRYCPTCGGKLQKNGHDRHKVQRWLCPKCNITTALKDDRQEKEKLVLMCLDWILTKKTAVQACEKYNISRSTLFLVQHFGEKSKNFSKLFLN